MDILELVGFAAGFLVAIALLPQVFRALKTKSTKDISIIWMLVLMSGLILWIIYAVFNKIVPLAIFATIEFLIIFTLFVLKLIYK